MNQIINTSISRRRFVVSSASLAGGLAITVALPGFADAASIAAQRHRRPDKRDQCLSCHFAGRRRPDPLAAQRDGAGRHHRAADDRRRGSNATGRR